MTSTERLREDMAAVIRDVDELRGIYVSALVALDEQQPSRRVADSGPLCRHCDGAGSLADGASCDECGGSGSPGGSDDGGGGGGHPADNPLAPKHDKQRLGVLLPKARATVGQILDVARRYYPSVPGANDPALTSTAGCVNCAQGSAGGSPIHQPVDASYATDRLCGWCGRFRNSYGVLPTPRMCEMHKQGRNVTRHARDAAFGDDPAYRMRLAERAREGTLGADDLAGYTGELGRQARALGEGAAS